jgi:nucleoside-diphosphate-sugar epimerase
VSRTLVTGATGFVGSACIARLEGSATQVHACARTVPSDLPASIVFHAVDLLDAVQLEALVADVRPTRLLHLAWVASPDCYWNAPENDDWVDRSAQLLDAFASAGGQRVVVAGSCAEYDWTSPSPYDEVESPVAGNGRYGRAKDRLRNVAQRQADEAGVSLAWARLFFLYGPREDPARFVPSVTVSLLGGRPAKVSAGSLVRDYLHVGDAAAVLVELLDSELRGVVNVGSGEGVSIATIAAGIADAVGRPDLLRVSDESSQGQPKEVVAKTRRLQAELGWRPAVELQVGLEETVSWWVAVRGRADPVDSGERHAVDD